MSVVPVPMSITDLVNEFQRGQMQLPEMQRGYVWNARQVRDLLDSLYRGYPTGNILRWERYNNFVELRDAAIDQKKETWANPTLLLDGQQRITSLSSVILGEDIKVKDSKKTIDIYFNVDYEEKIECSDINSEEDIDIPEEDDDEDDEDENDVEENISEEKSIIENYKKPFIVGNNSVKQNPKWISVKEIFMAKDINIFLMRLGIKSFDDPRYNKYSTRLNRVRDIKNYQFPVITLKKELQYEEVAEIFVRINSLGSRLKGSDLALAQITSKWKGSLKLFEDFIKECKKDKWSININILLRTLVAIITDQSKFKAVSNLSIQDLQDGWEKTKEVLDFTLSFLRQNFFVENEKLLSSPSLIIILAYFAFKKKKLISPEDTKLLKKWFLIANSKGRYSWGSTESKMDEDLSAICDNEINLLLVNLEKQFGRLTITEDDLKGKNRKSGFFKTMFILMHKYGAKDWKTNLVISTMHQGKKDKIEFHHIFPKNILKGKYESKNINDIANLTFIGKITNIKISDDYPEEYMNTIINERGFEILEEHCIPKDENLRKIDNFPKFIEERRKLICNLINNYLKEEAE